MTDSKHTNDNNSLFTRIQVKSPCADERYSAGNSLARLMTRIHADAVNKARPERNYTKAYRIWLAAASLMIVFLTSGWLATALRPAPEMLIRNNAWEKVENLTLADGTQVWLNAETELKYPVAFADEVREVMLTGEAYFEVAKNVSRPFVVKAGQLDIKVLGTSFNVKAYPSETQQATLVQGKVEVCAGNYSRKLQPGEQLNYSSEGPEIRNVDVKAYTAWKDRRFVFNDDLLEEVIRKLGRWYDVEFILRDAEVREIRFTGNLPKYRNLDQVLNKLELTTHIRFVQDGRAIEVFAE